MQSVIARRIGHHFMEQFRFLRSQVLRRSQCRPCLCNAGDLKVGGALSATLSHGSKAPYGKNAI